MSSYTFPADERLQKVVDSIWERHEKTVNDVQAEAFKLYHEFKLYHASPRWLEDYIADYFRREGFLS